MENNNEQEILAKIRKITNNKIRNSKIISKMFKKFNNKIHDNHMEELKRLAYSLKTDEGMFEAVNIIDDSFIQAYLASKIQSQDLKKKLLENRLGDNFYKNMVIETLEDDEIKAEFLKDIIDGIRRARGAATFKEDKYKKMFFDMVENKGEDISRNKAEIAVSVQNDELRNEMLGEIYKADYRRQVIKSFGDKKYVDKYFEEIKDDREILQKFYPEKIKEIEKEEKRADLIKDIEWKQRKIKIINNKIKHLEDEIGKLNSEKDKYEVSIAEITNEINNISRED